jgi:hypothetical protein
VLGHRPAAAGQPGLHRAGGRTDLGRDLGDAQADEVVQDDHAALVGRDLAERVHERDVIGPEPVDALLDGVAVVARSRLTVLRQELTALREATRRTHASGLSQSRTVAQRSQAPACPPDARKGTRLRAIGR